MRIFALVCIVLATVGCATRPDIVLDYDEDHDFGDYKTFTWLGDEPMTVEGDLRVPKAALVAAEKAIRQEMTSKGYVEVQDRAEADFGVGVVLGLNQTFVLDATDRTIYVPSERSGYVVNRPGRLPDSAVVMGSSYEEVSLDPLAHMAEEGKLAIKIYDLETGDGVWSVTATKDFTNDTPDGRNADTVLRRLLRDFPPE